jgi:hypothetical protein
MSPSLAAFGATFAALYAAHTVGDHWVQTHRQACGKGALGWPGRIWCARHVITLTITKLVALLALTAVTGLDIHPAYMAAGLGLDAASHYWADRAARHPNSLRVATLARLAEALGKGDFYRMGAPRMGRDDQPHLGTGAYALDQSFHVLFLFIAALIMAGGA